MAVLLAPGDSRVHHFRALPRVLPAGPSGTAAALGSGSSQPDQPTLDLGPAAAHHPPHRPADHRLGGGRSAPGAGAGGHRRIVGSIGCGASPVSPAGGPQPGLVDRAGADLRTAQARRARSAAVPVQLFSRSAFAVGESARIFRRAAPRFRFPRAAAARLRGPAAGGANTPRGGHPRSGGNDRLVRRADGSLRDGAAAARPRGASRFRHRSRRFGRGLRAGADRFEIRNPTPTGPGQCRAPTDGGGGPSGGESDSGQSADQRRAISGS